VNEEDTNTHTYKYTTKKIFNNVALHVQRTTTLSKIQLLLSLLLYPKPLFVQLLSTQPRDAF
jgi:hypothetical protein